MRAIQFTEPKSIRYVDVPEPGRPAAGEAIVRVHSVGICGTDYGGYLGKMPFFSYPRIFGHELGVEVVDVGADVTNVKPGDRCAVEPYINCQSCYSCKRGLTNCCEHHQTLGVHCDGGMRRLFALPARKLHTASGLTTAQCALVETLAIGCHAVDRGNPSRDETVLVIGAGPIGLSVIEFARLSAGRTLVADVNHDRLRFVNDSMGINEVIRFSGSDSESDEDELRRLTDGRMCDVVIDATGSHVSMSRALRYCAFGGRVVYVGISQADLQFPHAPVMHRRELTLLASRNAPTRDFPRIIELIASGRIDTNPWITHRASFDEAVHRFEEWLNPDMRVIKAVVDIG